MYSQDIKLGFSTGVLHKTHRTKEALKIMRDLKYDTVELGFVKLNRIEEGWLAEISDKDLMGFDVMGFQFDEQIQHIKISLNKDKNLDVNIFAKLNTIFESLDKLKEVEYLKQKVYDRIAGQQYLGQYCD